LEEYKQTIIVSSPIQATSLFCKITFALLVSEYFSRYCCQQLLSIFL